MTTITTTHIMQHIQDVTPEQIGRCFKYFDEQTKQWCYKVENERGERNADGELIEYTVRWTREHGFTCTCKSGQHGFANVRHASGVCKHIRWCVAASREERAALLEMQQQQAAATPTAPLLLIGDKPADAETLQRVLNAKAKPLSRAKARQPKAFRII